MYIDYDFYMSDINYIINNYKNIKSKISLIFKRWLFYYVISLFFFIFSYFPFDEVKIKDFKNKKNNNYVNFINIGSFIRILNVRIAN
jgi:hypothetical protein